MRFESNEMEPLSNNKGGRNLGICIPDYIISDILVDVYEVHQIYHTDVSFLNILLKSSLPKLV